MNGKLKVFLFIILHLNYHVMQNFLNKVCIKKCEEIMGVSISN